MLAAVLHFGPGDIGTLDAERFDYWVDRAIEAVRLLYGDTDG